MQNGLAKKPLDLFQWLIFAQRSLFPAKIF